MAEAKKILSLESLVEWLEKQPADEHYDWTDARHCCIGRWLSAMGTSDRDVFGKSNKLAMDDPFYEIAVAGPSGDGHTFGSALKRARDALAKSTPHPDTAVS